MCLSFTLEQNKNAEERITVMKVADGGIYGSYNKITRQTQRRICSYMFLEN